MRSIRSIDDAQIAIREIWRELDRQRANFSDQNKRRITNVAPSEHDYDVVVRKELEGLIGKGEGITTTSQGNLVTVLFTFTSVPPVMTLSSPPFICKRAYKPLSVSIAAVNPPTSTSALFNLRLNGVTQLLTSSLEMPVNTPQLEVLTVGNFVDPNLQWAVNDTVCIETIANGGISKFTIAILTRKF